MNHRLAKTYRRRWFVVGLCAAIIIFFIALQHGLLSGVNSVFSGIFRPIWVAENYSADFLSIALSSKKDVWKQNVRLREEVVALRLELAAAGSVKKENDDLKAIMGRMPTGAQFILGNILAKPNTTPYDTLIIDVGSEQGITPDMRVYVGGDVLMGEVESVEATMSRVLLYSAPGNITQVVYGNTGRFFNARGTGNGSFEVEVARDVDVAVGDMFFYPGMTTMPLGVVKKVEFDARDSFKKVLMKSPVNIQEERWVEVHI